MNERDDLERRLTSFGAAPTPPPSERLLAQLHADRLHTKRVGGRPRRLVRLPVLLPATAAVALALGLVLVLTGNDGSNTTTIVVANASDAVVERSGQVVDARAGQSLPEGAEVRTGASGSMTIGEVTLGPAERAVVRDGRVRRIERRAEIQSAPVTVDLEVRRGGGRVALRWSRYEGDDFGAYVIVRDGRVVTARRSIDRRIAINRTRPGRTSHYVVVVLDRERKIVARSQIVMG
jgi:hypothetical protein